MTPVSEQEPTAAPAPSAAPQQGDLPPPARRSVWTRRERMIRLVWTTLGRAAWVVAPPARASLIRLFGGSVGLGCALPREIEITIPWHVKIGDGVRLAPGCILYGLGMITIGDRTVMDREVHICAGSHDMTDSTFPLTKPPITIGADCFLGYDAYIGPGVTLGAGVRVHPRASVYRDAPAGAVLTGNPAKEAEPGGAP